MALLESLSACSGDDEDEDGSKASLETTFDLQRNLFGNSGFDTQDYVLGIEDF